MKIFASYISGIRDQSHGESYISILRYFVPEFITALVLLLYVIDQLKLENVEISSLDWRTFLRKARFPIDLFVARASLHTDQLLRMFQPSCYFQDATLAYWASRHWIMAKEEEQFFSKECDYLIQHKQRKIFLFKA